MFSPDYTAKLVDMHVRPLMDADLQRAAGLVRFSAEDDDMDAEEVCGARGARRRANADHHDPA
jgi:hypothetical protein